jgi:hypothetical protein
VLKIRGRFCWLRQNGAGFADILDCVKNQGGLLLAAPERRWFAILVVC